MIALLLLLLLALFPVEASAALPAGCENEIGLVGRTDILKCEPWETTSWWQTGDWWQDGGDPDPVPGGRVYHHGLSINDIPLAEIPTSGCVSGNCLKINYPAWNTPVPPVNGNASTSGYLVIPGIGGCSHDTPGCVPQQELWMRYYMKLSPNFDPAGYDNTGTIYPDANSGGKIPGLADGLNGGNSQCGNGGEGPTNGTECWTARMTFQPCANGFLPQQNGPSRNACADGGNPTALTRFGFYGYLYNGGSPGGTRFTSMFWDNDGRASAGPPCTATFGFGGGRFAADGTTPYCGIGAPGLINDKWYLIEVHIKMNDPGTPNGVMEGWIDGVLRYQKTNVIFRQPGHDNLGIRTWWMDIYHGGTGLAPHFDQAFYFDQLVIATGGRIGPVNGNLMMPVAVQADPVTPAGGFQHAYFISSLGCYYHLLAAGSPTTGDNSGRCYFPGSNWVQLFPSDSSSDLGTLGTGRDNYTSFYVDWRDELWMIGGSHIDPNSVGGRLLNQAGRMDFSGCHPVHTNCATWVAVAKEADPPDAAFTGIVKNSAMFPSWRTDNASACNAVAQKCMMGWGFSNFNAQHWLLENNVAHASGSLCNSGSASGAETMIFCELPHDPKNITNVNDGNDQPVGSGTTPGYRSQAMNVLTAGPSATQCFYITGTYSGTGDATFHKAIRDLWVFNCTTGAWTQLTSPPGPSTFPEYETTLMVYDSFRNQLLLQTYSHIYAYSIDNAAWTDVTPTGGLPWGGSLNSYGAYIPPPYGDLFIVANGNVNGGDPAFGLRGLTQSGSIPITTNAVVSVSSSPTTGAVITVSPHDINGQSSSSTSFTYAPTPTTTGTLTAPATFAGNPFSDWSGPCDSISTTVCNFTATGNRSYVAVYSAGSTNYDLTITSPGTTGVTMTVTPDINKTASCVPPSCTLTYASGTPVTITAPLINGTTQYAIWSAGCTSLTGNVCTVTMTGTKTVTATYRSGSTYQASLDFSSVQGQRNWSYCYTLSCTPMTWNGGQWVGPQPFTIIAGGGIMHPGAAQQSVRRWTASVAGNVRIAGSAFDASGVCPGSDGVGITIRKNSTTLINFALAHGNTTGQAFNLTTNVIAGDTIDFILDSGPNGNNTCDTTSFDAIIGPAATTRVFFATGNKLGVGLTVHQ